MSFRLGLTGSIGMGKSTTAAMFAEAGCAVWDADAAVHRLYAPGGAAIAPLAEAFPGAIDARGGVDRGVLRQLISSQADALALIETIVHPLVSADRAAFRATATAEILVFDIPLLFETGGEAEMDAVACVHVPADVQRARVLARNTMSESQFEAILAKQMPIAEKCARSDYLIETDTLDHARAQIDGILTDIRNRMKQNA